ncbi:hypothetical protein BKA64DRAFT_136262 [Cadophora sp. MPI-SDFR-AT-0126]|nr:hypothetical protein BKA64DRAFT_136262 [Leotiomycetes sp. MPI-SDFR-AT-0126]
MEIRGPEPDRPTNDRPAISRRSCDHCRVRKIACDRRTPCSNCTNAKLNCTHSTFAARSVTPKKKQESSERKINEIAGAVDDIKLLLQRLDISSISSHDARTIQVSAENLMPDYSPARMQPSYSEALDSPLGHHSVQVGRFVNDFLEGGIPSRIKPDDAFASLRNFVTCPAKPDIAKGSLANKKGDPSPSPSKNDMPPLEAAVFILRWAREHRHYYRVSWLSLILPLETFTEICQKVYFAVDDYEEVDYILVNGYLYWLFAEYGIVSDSDEYLGYCMQFKRNLHNTLMRLPILLQPSMKAVAALTMGALHGIEIGEPSLGWKFISMASNFCIVLGYHQRTGQGDSVDADRALEKTKLQLFWRVYEIDKGLSFRFGRYSNIRDSEITVPHEASAPRCARVAKIQGMVFEQLLSVHGLSRPECERISVALDLAKELRAINEEYSPAEESSLVDPNLAGDRMRRFYLRIKLSMHYSLLTLILQIIPAPPEGPDGIIEAAHAALVVHEECATLLRNNRHFMMMMVYTNWAIIHTPFIPFITLFNKCIKFSDEIELSRLEDFANSLMPAPAKSESPGGPLRLYQLLCHIARLYIDSNIASSVRQEHISDELNMDIFDMQSFGAGAESVGFQTTAGYHLDEDMGGWWLNGQNIPLGDGW